MKVYKLWWATVDHLTHPPYFSVSGLSFPILSFKLWIWGYFVRKIKASRDSALSHSCHDTLQSSIGRCELFYPPAFSPTGPHLVFACSLLSLDIPFSGGYFCIHWETWCAISFLWCWALIPLDLLTRVLAPVKASPFTSFPCSLDTAPVCSTIPWKQWWQGHRGSTRPLPSLLHPPLVWLGHSEHTSLPLTAFVSRLASGALLCCCFLPM